MYNILSLILLITIIVVLNPYSAGIDLSHQIQTTKVNPHTVRVQIFIMAVTHNIGIQMNQKDLTKTFMMISN